MTKDNDDRSLFHLSLDWSDYADGDEHAILQTCDGTVGSWCCWQARLLHNPNRRGRFGAPERGVYKSRITPHWFQNDTRFWYRNDLQAGAKEFIVVDAQKGTRQPAFDHPRLASGLSKAAGEGYKPDQLPFSDIEFIEDGKAIRFNTGDKAWRCDLSSYECTAAPGTVDPNAGTMQDQGEGRRGRGRGFRQDPNEEMDRIAA